MDLSLENKRTTPGLDQTPKNERALPSTAAPVTDYIDIEAEGYQLNKKQLVNKLGQRKEIWVKEKINS